VGNTFGLTPKGIIMICNSEEGLEHEIATATTGRATRSSGRNTRRETTGGDGAGLSMRAVGGVYFPMDAYLTPIVHDRADRTPS